MAACTGNLPGKPFYIIMLGQLFKDFPNSITNMHGIFKPFMNRLRTLIIINKKKAWEPYPLLVTLSEAYHSPPMQTSNADLTPICSWADFIIPSRHNKSVGILTYPWASIAASSLAWVFKVVVSDNQEQAQIHASYIYCFNSRPRQLHTQQHPDGVKSSANIQ